MSLPGGVSVLVDEDDIVDRVALDDHRTLFVTPSKVITFRERSLLTEESVEVYPTEVEQLLLDEGKRQATVTFEYADGSSRELQLPTDTMAAGLKALLASVIRAMDIVQGDEVIIDLHRFKELTLVVTDSRLLKHVGWALWATAYDAIDYATITSIETEEGQVSTGVNIGTTDGNEWLKVPQSVADRFVSRFERAVCEFHGVTDLGVLNGDPEAGEPDPEPDLDRLRPLQLNDPDELTTLDEAADTTDDHVDIDRILDQIEELTAAIESQQELLISYQDVLAEIETELTRDR